MTYIHTFGPLLEIHSPCGGCGLKCLCLPLLTLASVPLPNISYSIQMVLQSTYQYQLPLGKGTVLIVDNLYHILVSKRF